MTDADRIQILGAIDNHENLKNSFCWGGDNGNGQARTNREKTLNFITTVDIDGHLYSYRSYVQISRKNFYYKGFFSRDGKRGDVRLFKTLISTE
jgi:hypothetical protein